MATLDKRLPFGETVCGGPRLYCQNDKLFNGDGYEVRLVLEYDEEGQERRVAVLVDPPPPPPPPPPQYENIPRADKPLSFKGIGLGEKPIDPLDQTPIDWWNVSEETLRRAVEMYGEPYEERELAIAFLKSEGKNPTDLDA
jgi:hypothetical protein